MATTADKGDYAPNGALVTRRETESPPFTIGTLRRAIPAHCFERSVKMSFAYVAVDVTLMALLYWASTFIDSAPLPAPVRWGVLWPAYWFFQGAVGTGIWVLAHECGHQAFSQYGWLNDAVGMVLHSFLLVPYYSWKHSHHAHHANTGSLERDEVFVPDARDEPERVPHDDFEDLPVVRLGRILFALLLGWPLYLLMDVSSHPKSRFASHFDPWSPIFRKHQRGEVAISNAGLVAMASLLTYAARANGGAWFVKEYFIPYLIVNNWLVMITMLQHTHPALPHYRGKDWDWLRGALATVDRSYGFLDYFFHHIADTHVAHHLFSQIPHYHAEEATRAIVPVLGQYYARDDRLAVAALWDDFAKCRWVAPDRGAPKGAALWFH